jgi:hypothetical protein
MNILALLSQNIRTVSCHVGVGKSIKEVKVAGLDGHKPCLLDWET